MESYKNLRKILKLKKLKYVEIDNIRKKILNIKNLIKLNESIKKDIRLLIQEVLNLYYFQYGKSDTIDYIKSRKHQFNIIYNEETELINSLDRLDMLLIKTKLDNCFCMKLRVMIDILNLALLYRGKNNSMQDSNMEIERKFLVQNGFKANGENRHIDQGYLFESKKGVVRIRKSNNEYYLTIKSKTKGISRVEVEVQVSKDQGKLLFKSFCDKILKKRRVNVKYKNKIFEVDYFKGKLKGLVIAEIELKKETEKFEKPQWLRKEVSKDKKYLNSNLIKNF